MSVELPVLNRPGTPAKSRSKASQKQALPEDIALFQHLERIKSDLDHVHRNLDYATNPTMIDSYIYEIKALHMRYQFYLQLCKEKGLASSLFG